jgi:hypothetical protein
MAFVRRTAGRTVCPADACEETHLKASLKKSAAWLVPPLFVVLGGCATRTSQLYQWDAYQPEVYASLKGQTGPEDQIAAPEQALQKIRAKGTK